MKRLKSWPAWVLMLLVASSAVAVGATRDSGPSTQAERIDEISKRLACPTCDGESVYVSRASAAEALAEYERDGGTAAAAFFEHLAAEARAEYGSGG